jgi:ubiquinone/menaquinone biosynthesis C-methylase UbiE
MDDLTRSVAKNRCRTPVWKCADSVPKLPRPLTRRVEVRRLDTGGKSAPIRGGLGQSDTHGRPAPLDEVALAGVEHLDPAYVAGYDRKVGLDPSYETSEIALLQELGLGPESSLLDLGAGTGRFALAAAPHCKRVVAVDVSPAMIAVLEQNAAVRGVTNVECVQAGFLSYEHRGEALDFVYSRNALHHLPDFWKALALRRMRQLLRPGGVLRLRDVVFAFDVDQSDAYLAAWLDAAPASADEGWTRAELETHLQEEHNTFSWLLEPMLEQAGFAIEDAGYDSRRVFAEYVCRVPA